MTTPAVDAKNILCDNTKGYFIGAVPLNPSNLVFGVSVGYSMEMPNDLITIYEATAEIQSISLDKTLLKKENIQIISRSLDYIKAQDKAREIESFLHTYASTVSNKYTYSYNLAMPTYYLDRDKNNRFLFGVRFDAIRY